jgi:hypothetical protein
MLLAQVVVVEFVVGDKLWRILSSCTGFVFPCSRSAVNCWEIEKMAAAVEDKISSMDICCCGVVEL